MGKPKAPPPPDYTPIAAANKEVAQLNLKFAREQLNWAKQQHKEDSKFTSQIVDRITEQMDKQAAIAEEDRARYKAVYQPLEDDMVEKARKYTSEGYQDEQAGKAQADVSMQFQQAREAAQDQLEAFGVDPTQTRSQALDLQGRIQEAAARAGAGNMARDQAENKGLAIQTDMINVGKGYPSQYTAGYAGANQAANSAVNSTLATTATGAQSMGTAPQFMGAANTAIGNWGQLVNGIYSTQMEGYKARLNASSGIGGAIGGIVGGLVGLSDEREKDNIEEVGETHDGQPIYSFTYKGSNEPRMGLMAQDVEQRDPGAVQEDSVGRKFVDYDRALENTSQPVTQEGNGRAIPDDVIRYHGEKFFQKLEREAKEGRAQAIPT